MHCFLCEWDSRSKTERWEKHEWPPPPKKIFVSGVEKLIQEPLIDSAKRLIPLLLMKLGIMTHFLQVLDKMELVLNKYVLFF